MRLLVPRPRSERRRAGRPGGAGGVGQAQAVYEHTSGENGGGRSVADLTSEGGGLVVVGAGYGGVLLLSAVTGDTNAGEEAASFVERDATRRSVEPGACEPCAGGGPEVVNIRIRHIGKSNADQRPRGTVSDAGRKVSLDDETGGARGECLLVGAEEDGGAGLRDGDGALLRGDAGGGLAVGAEEGELAAITVHDCDDGAGELFERSVGALGGDTLDVGDAVGWWINCRSVCLDRCDEGERDAQS